MAARFEHSKAAKEWEKTTLTPIKKGIIIID
jgi:hypothetical protein